MNFASLARIRDRVRPTVLWVLAHGMVVAAYGLGRLGEDAESQKVTILMQIAGVLGLLGRKIIQAEAEASSLTMADRIRPTIALITSALSFLAMVGLNAITDPDYIVTVTTGVTLLVIGFGSEVVESESPGTDD